jgi:hypothetical protein
VTWFTSAKLKEAINYFANAHQLRAAAFQFCDEDAGNPQVSAIATISAFETSRLSPATGYQQKAYQRLCH